MSGTLLKTINLSVGYQKKPVVEHIDLNIYPGQMVALLGANGAGKSTLLKTVANLLKPIQGEIYIKGKPLGSISAQSLSKILAVVLTERLNVGFLTAFEVVAMGRYPHTGFLGKLSDNDKEKVWKCLKTVNAESLSGRYLNELSDGEKQKVLLARALAQEPELIILDEPTSHLDIRHKMEIMNILKQLSREQGIAVLFSLHETDLALKNCDIAVLIKKDRVVYNGAPEAMETKNVIADLYGIEQKGYDASFGMIEMTNENQPTVFVVGGGAKATGVFRMLTRHNIGFSTGVLHENDTDFLIAKTIGVHTISEKPFSEIGEDAFKMAEKHMEKCAYVIDTGFPVEALNRKNHQLILNALEVGTPVCILRTKEESHALYGHVSESALICEHLMEIAEICGGHTTWI